MGALSGTIADTDDAFDEQIVGRSFDIDALGDLLNRRPPAAAASDRPEAGALSHSVFFATANLRDAAEDAMHLPLTEEVLKRFGDVVMFKRHSDDVIKRIAARTAGKGLGDMGYDAEDSAAVAAAVAEKMVEGYDHHKGARQLKGKFKAIAGEPGFKDTYFQFTKAGKAEAKRKIRAATVQAFRHGLGQDLPAPPRAVFKRRVAP